LKAGIVITTSNLLNNIALLRLDNFIKDLPSTIELRANLSMQRRLVAAGGFRYLCTKSSRESKNNLLFLVAASAVLLVFLLIISFLQFFGLAFGFSGASVYSFFGY